MVKTYNTREVIEDAVVGNSCHKHEKFFGAGYDTFQFPFTVSFTSEGEYRVVINGKRAIAEKVDKRSNKCDG